MLLNIVRFSQGLRKKYLNSLAGVVLSLLLFTAIGIGIWYSALGALPVKAQTAPVLTLTPNETVRVGANTSFQFIALLDTNGSSPGGVYDVTSYANWSEDSSYSTIDKGTFSAYYYPGNINVTVSVSFEGLSDTVAVEIINVPDNGLGVCTVWADGSPYRHLPNFGTGIGWSFEPPHEGWGVVSFYIANTSEVTTITQPTSLDNFWGGRIENNAQPGAKRLPVTAIVDEFIFHQSGYFTCSDLSVIVPAPDYSTYPGAQTYTLTLSPSVGNVNIGYNTSFTLSAICSSSFSGPITGLVVTNDFTSKPNMALASTTLACGTQTLLNVTNTAGALPVNIDVPIRVSGDVPTGVQATPASALLRINSLIGGMDVQLSASPTTVVSGSSTNLLWDIEPSATSCQRSAVPTNSGWPNGAMLASDITEGRHGPHQTAPLYQDTTFSITCWNGTASDTASVLVLVTPSPCLLTGLSISPAIGARLDINQTRTYIVTATYSNGTSSNVTNSGQTVYSSSNTNVATIPSYGDAPGGGTATARGEGDATITVSRTEPGDGAGCNKTANAVISVNPVPAPAFEVDGNLSFFAYRNDPLPTPQFLTIRNTGNVILPFTVATNTTIYNQSLSNTNPLGNSDPLSVTVPVGGSWDVYYQPKSTASAGTSFVWNLSFNSNSSAGTKTKTALYTVSQPPQNLTLNCGSITPSILQSVDQGDTALWTVPYTQAGLSTPILFSISALEGSTSTGSTTATPPPASGSQTVSITTTASTPTTPNPHSLVIRAISGTISRTCNVSLEVLPSPPPPPCTLASLIIDPVGGPNLSIGGTRNYAVTAYYNNGNPPANVKNSGQTLYSSSNTSVATILSPGGGNATAVGNGTATITVTRQEPGEPVGCSKSAEALINVGDPANLDLSDKDLIKVNNNSTSAGTSAQQCSGVSEVFSLPNQGIFKTGDVVRFKINVCNSGGQQLTNVRVVDTTTNLANLTYLSSSNNCVTNANDATGTYILANVPAESGGVPAVCSFELRATVASPGGPAGSWYRFQNVATITSDQVTKTVRTPPYLFSAGAGVPNRNETAP